MEDKDRLLIDFISIVEYKQLEADWRRLEMGHDMTIFQSYEWYKMFIERSAPSNTFYYESVLAVVKDNGVVSLIAPLWVVKHTFRIVNKKGVYILGRDSWSDYLNFVYDTLTFDMVKTLIAAVCRRYELHDFIFEQLRSTSLLFDYLKMLKSDFNADSVCVSLVLPPSVEVYFSQLSKNTRQNIRTAYNRLSKDNLDIRFVFDDANVDKERCLQIRQDKLKKKYDEVSIIRKTKYRLRNKLLYHFPRCQPIYDYPDSKVMAAYINDDLSAFFNYVVDSNSKSIMIIAAGTNLNYLKYSPGILLMYNYICQTIKENRFRFVDFTRGDERYKIALGGTLSSNVFVHYRF